MGRNRIPPIEASAHRSKPWFRGCGVTRALWRAIRSLQTISFRTVLSELLGKSTYGKKELIFALGYSQSYTTNVSASPAAPHASATSSNCNRATLV